MKKEYEVWSNMANYRDYVNEFKNNPDVDTSFEGFCENIENWVDDERANLRHVDCNDIVAFAELGLWNRTAKGYKRIDGGVDSCLYLERDCDSGKFVVDSYGHFESTQYHHDGVNKIRYMEWKENYPEWKKEEILNNIVAKHYSPRMIRRYFNNLGYKIAKVYGWKLNR